MSNTLSQETVVSNTDFVLWSLHNISLGSSAPVLLNKQTHQTCGQPHEIRKGLVLCVDLVSNLGHVCFTATGRNASCGGAELAVAKTTATVVAKFHTENLVAATCKCQAKQQPLQMWLAAS
jgi:hypothetical protein